MSKRLCKDLEALEEKIAGRKIKFVCSKCDRPSPKEKWCCKPKEIKR